MKSFFFLTDAKSMKEHSYCLFQVDVDDLLQIIVLHGVV